jgi:hypothetical protein
MPILTELPPASFTAPCRLNLVNAVLPAAPGTTARLDVGANVLFAGCRDAHALLAVARQFPRSRFLATEPAVDALAGAREAVRHAGLQNTQAGRPDTLRQARLQGIFEFIIRQGGEASAPMNALPSLLRDGGLLFDLGRELPSPADYHEAGLVILRSIRLADGCACIIAGNWQLSDPRA